MSAANRTTRKQRVCTLCQPTFKSRACVGSHGTLVEHGYMQFREELTMVPQPDVLRHAQEAEPVDNPTYNYSSLTRLPFTCSLFSKHSLTKRDLYFEVVQYSIHHCKLYHLAPEDAWTTQFGWYDCYRDAVLLLTYSRRAELCLMWRLLPATNPLPYALSFAIFRDQMRWRDFRMAAALEPSFMSRPATITKRDDFDVPILWNIFYIAKLSKFWNDPYFSLFKTDAEYDGNDVEYISTGFLQYYPASSLSC